MSNASSPKVDYTQEVRFAVVMYGGVSLAIYINGIAQELLHLVRATAQVGEDANKEGIALSYEELTGTERVYRKLSYLLAEKDPGSRTNTPGSITKSGEHARRDENIRTRFVVDIISGTSAGGINGIFLAKALANGQDLKPIEQLWIREGEIKRLLNDKESVEPPLDEPNPPESLLNSHRMYLELLKAFDIMDKKDETTAGTASNAKAAPAAYVDELDLFVTTTDLAGVTLPIRLADDVVYERRHRNVLHFIYSKAEVSGEPEDRNDLEKVNNPFLAFAARCTSAFPFAFEPMSLCDSDKVLKQFSSYAKDPSCLSGDKQWQRFYKDYLNPVGVRTIEFPKRSFADGGYLDNKPFTYATEALGRRHADVPVKRKLLYIEPSPEHPEDEREDEHKPDAIENVGAALLSLPRYETIREDLQRVLDHNRLVRRVKTITEGVERDAGKARKEKLARTEQPKQLTDPAWATLDLAEMVGHKGPGYVAYHRLEIASVTDELARLVTRVAGLDDQSDYFIVVRSLTRAWRLIHYTEYHEASRTPDNPGKPTLNSFLFEFNLSYPMRRIDFLRAKIDSLCRDSFKDNPAQQEKLLEIKKTLNDCYKKLRRTGRLLRSRQLPPEENIAQPANSDAPGNPPVSPVFEEIARIKEALQEKIAPMFPKAESPILEYFLCTTTNGSPQEAVEAETDRRADDFLNSNPDLVVLFDAARKAIDDRIRPAKADADKNCRTALGLPIAEDERQEDKFATGPPDAETDPLGYLAYCYQYYDDYDVMVFPILYGTEIGEAAPVDVLRISPEDARALIDERKLCCHKLAGTALGHFGAFLDPLWRKNDILWGRLDGAERIITALLPNDAKWAGALTGEAHAAIIEEAIKDLGEKEAEDLLCEAAMRSRSGEPDTEVLETFIGNLKQNAPSPGALDTLIDERVLRQHYLETFPTRSKLEPHSTLNTAARATSIIGNLLSGLADRRRVKLSYVAWIARLGQIFWALVEVAVPHSIPNLLFRHWLKLLYLFEVVVIVGATLLARPGVSQFGWTALGITAGVNLAAFWLGDYMSRRGKVKRFVILVGATFITLLTLIGLLKVAGVLGLRLRDAPPLALIHQTVLSWFPFLSPQLLNLGLGIFALLIVLVLLYFLWKQAEPPQTNSGLKPADCQKAP